MRETRKLNAKLPVGEWGKAKIARQASGGRWWLATRAGEGLSSQVSFGRILKAFFSVAHDPTEVNRQGPDSGTQYRSAVFYEDDGQQRIARAYIEQLYQATIFRKPIATQSFPLYEFKRARE